MTMDKKETMTYESEIRDTIETILRENTHVRQLGYFLHTAWRWFGRVREKRDTPQIVVLGTAVPEELLLAAGSLPYYILGGSLKAAAWSDDAVPRDTDPISRSMLGFLLAQDEQTAARSLYIVPLTSDSMRKIAFLLKSMGRKVHTLDIPPQRDDPLAVEKWRRQTVLLAEAAAAHTGKCVTARSILRAVQQVDDANKQALAFLQAAAGREDLLSAAARMLVLNSYYYTEDILDWTVHLQMLTDELSAYRKRFAPRLSHLPQVLLMGSPVLFPNYKVPFLLRETGLAVGRCADASTLKLYCGRLPEDTPRRLEPLLEAVADRRFRTDGSPAFTVNEALYRYFQLCLKRERWDGVVYHVLKGQIEYDFELERFEKLFDSYGIPVFRLETDYQYQDVEQLRIRMEAFAEMLTQRKYTQERKAQ